MAKKFVKAQSQRYTEAVAPVTAVPLTLACFGSAGDLTNNHPLFAVTDGGGAAGHDTFFLQFSGFTAGDPIVCGTGAAASYATAASPRAYEVGRVYHVCGVFSGVASRTLYVNGESQATDTNSRTPTGINSTQIAASGTSGYGDISNAFDAAIWNVALTASEVLRLAKGDSPLTVRRDALVAYWPLDELGDSVLDVVAGNRLLAAGTSNPTAVPTPYGYRQRGKTARIYRFAPEIAAGGGSTIPVFRHHYVQQGIA